MNFSDPGLLASSPAGLSLAAGDCDKAANELENVINQLGKTSTAVFGSWTGAGASSLHKNIEQEIASAKAAVKNLRDAAIGFRNASWEASAAIQAEKERQADIARKKAAEAARKRQAEP